MCFFPAHTLSISAAVLIFDRSALFDLSIQLLFNVPVTDSKENIESATMIAQLEEQ